MHLSLYYFYLITLILYIYLEVDNSNIKKKQTNTWVHNSNIFKMIYRILFKVTYRSFYIKEACPNYGQECTMFSRMIHSLTFKEHSCTKVSESSLLIPQFDRSRNSSFLFHKLDFQECHVFSIISFPIHIAGQNF